MNTEDIQKICRNMKGVTEDIKWGHDLVFSVGGKMFCVVGLDQVPVSSSFKVADDEFESMTERDGIIPAPYVAKYKWVLIEDIQTLSPAEWKRRLKKSYELVFAKLPLKIKKQLEVS